MCLGRCGLLPGSLRLQFLLGDLVEKKGDLTTFTESLTSLSHFFSATGVEFLAQKIQTIDFLGVFA